MKIIEWKQDFALGIPEIDAEHRELIGLINAAGDLLGGAPEPDGVESFLGEVHARIAAHFALEERAMQDSGYPEYAAHKADHERLLDEIVDRLEDGDPAGQFDVQAFASFLESWFGGHFRTFDARLHGTMKPH